MSSKLKNRLLCSAYGCSMQSKTNLLSKITMHRFPKETYRRRKWELAVRRKDWKASPWSVICSLHFINGKPSKEKSDPDYVPSIFSYNTPNFGKVVFPTQSHKNVKRKRNHQKNKSEIENKTIKACSSTKENSIIEEETMKTATTSEATESASEQETESFSSEFYLSERRRLKQNVLKIMLLMIDGNITEDNFSKTCEEVSLKDYDELAEERRQYNMCCFPMCNNYMPIPRRDPSLNSFAIETWRKYFCSVLCYESSNNLKNRLSNFLLEMDLDKSVSLKLFKETKNG